jgi:hypothetical protein
MINFVVGNQYQNGKGLYTVREIYRDKTMLVRYEEDWSDHVLDMALQSRIIENRASPPTITKAKEKQTSEQKELNPSFFWTLGFLSRHGYIGFSVPSKKVDYLRQWYQALTGEELKETHTRICENKWYAAYTMSFLDSGIDLCQLDFCIRVNPYRCLDQGRWRTTISSRSFISMLFDYGFRAGTNHDTEKILINIPDQYKPEFLDGLKDLKKGE